MESRACFQRSLGHEKHSFLATLARLKVGLVVLPLDGQVAHNPTLPDRLMVGLWFLAPAIEVRILVGQHRRQITIFGCIC